MKIVLNINKLTKDCLNTGRTNFYAWDNMEHLKRHYADVVDPSEIDMIADKIRKMKTSSTSYRFLGRKDLTPEMNEQCLCNLIELEILEKNEVLDKFLKKPLVSNLVSNQKNKQKFL